MKATATNSATPAIPPKMPPTTVLVSGVELPEAEDAEVEEDVLADAVPVPAAVPEPSFDPSPPAPYEAEAESDGVIHPVVDGPSVQIDVGLESGLDDESVELAKVVRVRRNDEDEDTGDCE